VKFSLPGFGSKSIVGLDVGSSSIKAVELSKKSKNKNFELTHMGVAQVPAEAIVQGAFLNSSAITEAIQEAIENAKIKTPNVAAAVCGHSVIVKKVSLPQMTRDELDEQIRWEAEQYIPFDVNEVNLDFQILESSDGEGQMDVLLVAAKKDLIDDYVQVIREAGLTPVAVDVAGFAIENAFEANYDTAPDDVIALVNIGAQVVNINIMAGGVPCFTRDITTAGNQYTEEIQKALSISFEEAERIKLSRINKVYLSGGSARVPGLEAAFHERTGLDVETLNPLSRMLPSDRFDQEYLDDVSASLSVGVGLALREADL
jgi:type IV pilus assembly protein PilM